MHLKPWYYSDMTLLLGNCLMYACHISEAVKLRCLVGWRTHSQWQAIQRQLRSGLSDLPELWDSINVDTMRYNVSDHLAWLSQFH